MGGRSETFAMVAVWLAVIAAFVIACMLITSCVADQRNAGNFRECVWKHTPEQCEYLR